MSSWTVDPPGALVLVVGAGALMAWLWFAPPYRAGLVRGSLRTAAALLFAAALLGVACEGGAGEATGRVVVLVDGSRSMDVPDSGVSRAARARQWMAGPEFEAWSAGWRVEIDSFGGRTSDLGAALDEVETTLPDAIVIVTDGRAARGRAAEVGSIPIFGWRPEPATVADAAVLDMRVESEGAGGPTAVVEIGAVGGSALDTGGQMDVAVGGRVVSREPIPALEAGERFSVRVPLPTAARRPAEVMATVTVPGDAVADNDRRSALWRSPPESERTLVLGLRAGWDLASFVRELRATTDDVDVFWLGPGSALRRPGGATATSWSSLPIRRYGVAYVFGDPEALGPEGAAWLERFGAAGGKGLYWAPGAYGGELAGSGTSVAAGGARVDGVPELTLEGSAWLTARGFAPRAGPDGGAGWSAIEALPGRSPQVPGDATVLLSIGERPVAWALERGTTRSLIVLGVGYYRWAIDGATRAESQSREFWLSWVGAMQRWMKAATPVERVGVRMPPDERIGVGERLRATLAGDLGAGTRWRIERLGGEPEVVDRGEVATDGVSSAIVAGPFEPGIYALVVEIPAERWAVETPFIVEAWVPDLAWTEADTASLGLALTSSGGGWIDATTPPLRRAAGFTPTLESSRRVGLGTSPWPLLIGIGLVLADWALALTRRRAAT